MKDIIVLVAFIALGLFISSAVMDFKDPVDKNITAAVNIMNDNLPTAP